MLSRPCGDAEVDCIQCLSEGVIADRRLSILKHAPIFIFFRACLKCHVNCALMATQLSEAEGISAIHLVFAVAEAPDTVLNCWEDVVLDGALTELQDEI